MKKRDFNLEDLSIRKDPMGLEKFFYANRSGPMACHCIQANVRTRL